MKKTIVNSTLIALAATVIPTVSAVTTTPKVTEKVTPSVAKSASASPTIVKSDVKELREKVAAKVSELKEKNHKPFAGTISKIADNTLTITTAAGSNMEVKIDTTLTSMYQISGSTTRELKKETLKENDYIIVTGPVLDKTITANLIYRDETFIVGSGKIIEVNADDLYIKVIAQDKTTYTIDIERTTQQSLLNIKTLAPEKISFSKLKEGDLVHFVGKKPSEKDVTRLPGVKILIVPQEYFNK